MLCMYHFFGGGSESAWVSTVRAKNKKKRKFVMSFINSMAKNGLKLCVQTGDMTSCVPKWWAQRVYVLKLDAGLIYGRLCSPEGESYDISDTIWRKETSVLSSVCYATGADWCCVDEVFLRKVRKSNWWMPGLVPWRRPDVFFFSFWYRAERRCTRHSSEVTI